MTGIRPTTGRRKPCRGTGSACGTSATGWRPGSTAPPPAITARARKAVSGSSSLCRSCVMPEKRPLRTLIVDDEPLAIERLQILCSRIAGLSLVGTAADGAGALRLIESLAPDLLLLDIQMPGLDGMAVARALADRASRPALIFVTAFDQFAVAAFDVAAVDYLLKPVEAERLERAVARVRKQIEAAQPAPAISSPWIHEFWVPHRAEIIRIAAR